MFGVLGDVALISESVFLLKFAGLIISILHRE